MPKCAACGKFLAQTDGVKCSICVCLYHRGCVGIPQDTKVASTWTCPTCKAKVPRKDNKDTPVKGLNSDYFEVEAEAHNIGAEEIDLAQELKLFRGELGRVRHEMISFRNEIAALNSTIQSFNKRLDDVEGRISTLEKNQPSNFSGDHEELLHTINQLKSDINDRDQELLSSDIEISGLPEVKGENINHLVLLVASKLDVTITEQDMIYAERSGIKRAQASGTPPAPRRVSVRFARRALRDELLRSARVRRGADTAGFDIPGEPCRFYVNEKLTKINKHLFYRAREEARKLNWWKPWTRGGQIYARKDSSTRTFKIRNESDILKVFGSPTV